MSNSEDVDRPSIIYRLVEPSDLEVLEHLHAALFPIRYEREFFLNVVNRRGIVSWVAVDTGGSDSEDDQLIGFVTTRIIAANESEIEDLLKYDASRRDQVLVYILTLGVAPQYRKRGIANSLVQEVIKYASNMLNCRGVYLHVIAYNKPAIKFYKKMQFKHVRRLPHFYYIQGQHYDSLLFVFFVNDGRSPCCPLSQSCGNRFDCAETLWQQLQRSLRASVICWLRSFGRMRRRRWPCE